MQPIASRSQQSSARGRTRTLSPLSQPISGGHQSTQRVLRIWTAIFPSCLLLFAAAAMTLEQQTVKLHDAVDALRIGRCALVSFRLAAERASDMHPPIATQVEKIGDQPADIREASSVSGSGGRPTTALFARPPHRREDAGGDMPTASATALTALEPPATAAGSSATAAFWACGPETASRSSSFSIVFLPSRR